VPFEDAAHHTRNIPIAREIWGYEDPIGHTRSARIAGMAERTPNRLASYEAAQTTERLPRQATNYWLAAQLRIISLLDGSIECVHIDMHDFTNGHFGNNITCSLTHAKVV
jgi:hypothetical protein